MTGRIWTDERINQLCEMWSTDMTTEEIGKALRLSKSAITGKAHRLGLVARPSPIIGALTPEERERRLEDDRARRQARLYGGVTLEPFVESEPPREAPKPLIEAPPRSEYKPVLYRQIESCCFPIGTPGKPDFRYCDEPTKEKAPYCAEHCAKTYLKTTITAEKLAGNMAITAGRVAVWT